MLVSANLISFLKVKDFSSISLGVLVSISENGTLKSSYAISKLSKSSIRRSCAKLNFAFLKLFSA